MSCLNCGDSDTLGCITMGLYAICERDIPNSFLNADFEHKSDFMKLINYVF